MADQVFYYINKIFLYSFQAFSHKKRLTFYNRHIHIKDGSAVKQILVIEKMT